MMPPTGVVQLIDALKTGGAEKVAVDIANALPASRFRSWISATREQGLLAQAIGPDVGQFHLQRTARFDSRAIRTFAGFLRSERIEIVHAHSTSLFFGCAAAALAGSGVKVIWHAHFGKLAASRLPLAYRIAFWRASAAIGVTEPLAERMRRNLGLGASHCRYIANFLGEPPAVEPARDLPGAAGNRVVLVANFRREKNHPFVLEAMRRVVDSIPGAVLLLVGTGPDRGYIESIEALRHTLGLERNVFLLGHRADIHAVLKACDVAIIGSSSEGLPIALLEYGMARKAVVSTDVGQCGDVLAGACGVVVPTGLPERFAAEITRLLSSPEDRRAYGEQLYNKVQDRHNQASAIREIVSLYESVLGRQSLR
jgi:glycosyltransferase involved in cell wall biosynthesis